MKIRKRLRIKFGKTFIKILTFKNIKSSYISNTGNPDRFVNQTVNMNVVQKNIPSRSMVLFVM